MQVEGYSFPEFAPVQSGGSLIIAWQLKGKRVLLVGGGTVAASRLEHILSADALVTVIAPKTSLNRQVAYRISQKETRRQITFHDRLFNGPEDLEGVDMVLTAIDDVEESRRICHLARERRIPVNVADVPPECDFYFGSMIRRGPLQVMVSTGGKGPKLASIIRQKIEDAIPANAGNAIEKVGKLREELRKRAPGVGGKLGQKRMDWMIEVCDTWGLDDLGELDDELVMKLLDESWEKGGKVPSYEELAFGEPPPSKKARRRSQPSASWLAPSSQTIGGFGAGVLVTVASLWLLRRFK